MFNNPYVANFFMGGQPEIWLTFVGKRRKIIVIIIII